MLLKNWGKHFFRQNMTTSPSKSEFVFLMLKHAVVTQTVESSSLYKTGFIPTTPSDDSKAF